MKVQYAKMVIRRSACTPCFPLVHIKPWYVVEKRKGRTMQVHQLGPWMFPLNKRWKLTFAKARPDVVVFIVFITKLVEQPVMRILWRRLHLELI